MPAGTLQVQSAPELKQAPKLSIIINGDVQIN
jgi:hypothetical protein